MQRAQGNKLTVWLQVDAQSGWPDVVAAANSAFGKANPGWTVDVQYQNWGDHLQKFDATIAGNDTPDVIEIGKYTAVTGQFVMPSHVAGKSMPGFLGGSDLAVPAQSSDKATAIQWIADFTSTASERALEAQGNIPNATSLLGTSVNERAAIRSWFVPVAKHLVDVENGNILRTMRGEILSGHLTVAQAAQVASASITRVLNQP